MTTAKPGKATARLQGRGCDHFTGDRDGKEKQLHYQTPAGWMHEASTGWQGALHIFMACHDSPGMHVNLCASVLTDLSSTYIMIMQSRFSFRGLDVAVGA